MQPQPIDQPLSARRAAYLIGRERFETGSPGFPEAIAAAHAQHRRPRCLCRDDGIEMYVARLAGTDEGFIVKRMPDTGSRHAVGCSSYEPPAKLSGLGQMLGSAIIEDPATGETTLRLDFPLSKLPGRSVTPTAAGNRGSAKSEGEKLSLLALLHYLWDQAELTRWQPGFAGKRSWATVRRLLLNAAENKVACGIPLPATLYIPEPFSVEQRNPINGRRLAHWSPAITRTGKPLRRILLIAEVKEIAPTRYGFRATIKHIPDQPFALDGPMFRRLERRFEYALSLWGANKNIHMMAIATFVLSRAGIPTIDELSLMPVTSQWLAVEDWFDMQLTERLVSDGRSFIKPLRYNLPTTTPLPTALLTDTGDAPTPVGIEWDGFPYAHDCMDAITGMRVEDSST